MRPRARTVASIVLALGAAIGTPGRLCGMAGAAASPVAAAPPPAAPPPAAAPEISASRRSAIVTAAQRVSPAVVSVSVVTTRVVRTVGRDGPHSYGDSPTSPQPRGRPVSLAACLVPQVSSSSLWVSSRSRDSARRKMRDTCICETPI